MVFFVVIITHYNSEKKIVWNRFCFQNINYLTYITDNDELHLYPKKLYKNAVKYGDVDILDWIYHQNDTKYLTASLFKIGVERSDFSILNWLKSKRCLYNDSVRYKAFHLENDNIKLKI